MLNLPAPEDSHWKTKLRRIDFPGAIVLIVAVLGFLVGFDRGSNVSWTLPLTVVSLSVSAFLFVLFVIVEIYYATEPFAPGHIIFDRGFVAAYGCNFFSFGGWLSGLFYLPLYFQAMDGVSATSAGLRLLPCICAGVSGSLFSGFVMRWTGKYYWLTVIGYTSLTLGLTVIFLFSGGITDSLLPILLGTIACAFGNGIGVTTTLISLSKCPLTFAKRAANVMHSLKCHPRGPGCCHGVLLPLSVFGLCYRPCLVLHCRSTGSKRALERSPA
jgi:hypothetical protein